jgi:hypothetical protein
MSIGLLSIILLAKLLDNRVSFNGREDSYFRYNPPKTIDSRKMEKYFGGGVSLVISYNESPKAAGKYGRPSGGCNPG